MSSTVNIKASGLVLSPNQLEVPPGSLIEASDVIIKRDNVVEPRRGLKLYGSTFPSIADRAMQLMFYKTRILRQYFDNNSSTNLLQFDSNGLGLFETFAGTYNPAQAGLRTKFIEANGNFYFTSDIGIRKISALTAGDFTTASPYITPAGGIKATDVNASIILQQGLQTGFLPQDSTVAYSVVWGSKDANGNLILGTPSQVVDVYNPLLNMLLLDYNTLLLALDNISPSPLIKAANYVNTFKLPSTASATDLYTSLDALCLAIDTDLLLANTATAPLLITTPVPVISGGVCTVTFSTGDPTLYMISGDFIKIAGFVPTSGVLDGLHVVTNVTPTTITFNTLATGPVTLSTPTIHSYNYEARMPAVAATVIDMVSTPLGGIYPIPATPPTDDDLVNLQNTILSIMERLQAEPNAIINKTTPTPSTSLAGLFIGPLTITTTANVNVTFSIPQDVTLNNFYQIYRSNIMMARGPVSLSNLSPGAELQLVYEAYVTPQDLINKTITIVDMTPDSFAGAYLYTNQISGQGSLQANDVPPFALDINRYKNTIFFANTKTRQRNAFSLLGVQQMVTGYNPSNPPTITITNGTTTNTYTFVLGVAQIVNAVFASVTGGTLAASGTASYFTINSANNAIAYYVWYSIGTATDPGLTVTALAGKVGIKVIALVGDTDVQIASKTRDTISGNLFDFNAVTSTPTTTIKISNTNLGYAANPTAGNMPGAFSIAVGTAGKGENASTNQVLLSTNVSPSLAVDETARSLIRVINQNSLESTYLYYTSSVSGVPGQFLAESRSINGSVFYMVGNNSTTGLSFSPNLGPDLTITNISAATSAVITTSAPHGLINGDSVVIANSNSTPSIDGVWPITYISPTTFSIPVTTTIAGSAGVVKVTLDAVASANEGLPNRIYYSKLNEPDAVPIVNTIDVGAKDKAILRIFPLRDSLFIFKEDGLFRISGEVAPFTLSLFDASTVLVAADSLGLSNNLIYGWTTQGISATGESGVHVVSRPIDTDILKLASNSYTNFSTATWGLGYESDNSYIVFTNKVVTDIVATIGYRYSNLTNTWTNITKSELCGIINSTDDRMYLGPADANTIEQERKTFTRLDYADRELSSTITLGSYHGNTIALPSIYGYTVGDGFVQDQTLSVYTFNNLLKKLDLDTSLLKNYYSTLHVSGGADLTTAIAALSAKLVADPSTFLKDYSTLSGLVSGSISGISIANPTHITSTGHGLVNGRVIQISGVNFTSTGTVSTGASTITALSGTTNISPGSSVTGPDLAPNTIVTGITSGSIVQIDPPAIGSTSGTYVFIGNPPVNGTYVVTVIDANTFSIPLNVILTAGITGSFITIDSSFMDIQASYNAIINNLNIDSGVSFKNYLTNGSTTEIESTIIAINAASKTLTLNNTLDYVVGPVTIFQAINSEFTYSPNTMGDPLSLKHFSEATVMFENKAFSKSTFSFASDLNPAFVDVVFSGDGSGIFGSGKFGMNYFGGNSNSAPFRTYVPAVCQRCRYLLLKFNHRVAREKVTIFGVSLTGNITSGRAYR